MKRKKIATLIVLLIAIKAIIYFLIILLTNKTFFKNTYIGVQNQKIFIPRYSFFKDECCMTAATFYSLKSEKKLQKEIDDYMKDFEYFSNESTYGYRKGDLFIQTYEVENNLFYRKIIIVY